MILLVDISREYWRNWFATQSGIRAYELTIDTLEWYVQNYERAIVCCEGGQLKRTELYPEYKAHRPPKPHDAIDSLTAVVDRVTAWGVPIARAVGYEADDIIATLAGQAWVDEVRILGDDKDLYQLINDGTRLLTKRGEVDADGCVRKFGVRPDQMRDYLALVGDASDNVPGCPSVGPGRAADLLTRFDTLDAVMEAADEELLEVRKVGKKTLAALREWDPALAVSLVTLLDDAPVSLDELIRGDAWEPNG